MRSCQHANLPRPPHHHSLKRQVTAKIRHGKGRAGQRIGADSRSGRVGSLFLGEEGKKRVRVRGGSQIGDAAIIDMLVVVSYYHGLAHLLQALDVELPEGVTSALTY